jgi:hypothetical protein
MSKSTRPLSPRLQPPSDCHVLCSTRPTCGCTAGLGRVNFPETRPSGSPQTYAVGPGVRASTAHRFAVVVHRRTHHIHSAAVWCSRAPAHSRTAFGPAGKKTPVTITGADARSPVDLVSLYEQLRRRALDGGRGIPRVCSFEASGYEGLDRKLPSCLPSACSPSPVVHAHHSARVLAVANSCI